MTFPFSALTLLVGRHESTWTVKTGCWSAGGDDLTGALHVLYLQLSSLLPSSLAPVKSRMESFRYWLTGPGLFWKITVEQVLFCDLPSGQIWHGNPTSEGTFVKGIIRPAG